MRGIPYCSRFLLFLLTRIDQPSPLPAILKYLLPYRDCLEYPASGILTYNVPVSQKLILHPMVRGVFGLVLGHNDRAGPGRLSNATMVKTNLAK